MFSTHTLDPSLAAWAGIFRALPTEGMAFQRSVEDVMLWEPPQSMKDADKHPLAKLRPRKRKGNITANIKDLPPDKLNTLRDYIEKLQKPE